ncbi:fluoride efflux transporter FluC [Nocardioides sp. MAHUQ-72]|uniref:fluoride efflux transporter FluC n=1 Tax=unclassified Nocardioides TaxID=2615069 RepID=UPI0036158DB7
MTPVLVALGAAVGAPLRLLAGHWLDHRFPWGTLTVNVVGSFLLGLLTAAAPGEHALALLGTGFCGGFTTYSAFAVKAHERGPAGGTAYAVVTLALALPACALGYLLG